MHSFDRIIAVDWSGAKGRGQRGISVAALDNDPENPPHLIRPPCGSLWSRQMVANWLNEEALKSRILVGFDFSFGFPFLDQQAFFPGQLRVKTIHGFWELVADICKEAPDLYAGPFVSHPDFSRYFMTGDRSNIRNYRRYRVCETATQNQGLGRSESVFHLVGSSQVGLASLSGMLVLRQLKNFDIWPMDAISGQRSAVIEIYSTAMARHGGEGKTKIRDRTTLNRALSNLKTAPFRGRAPLSDHDTDALVTAAGMRYLMPQQKFWQPTGLDDIVRQTEGWTFGVR